MKQLDPHGIGKFPDILEKIGDYLTENKSKYDGDDIEVAISRDDDGNGSRKKRMNLGELYRDFLNRKRGR
jgi:hypothetical protein